MALSLDTSHGIIKKGNRKSEVLLREVEVNPVVSVRS